MPTDYPSLLRQLDEWFSDGVANAAGAVPCRAGCNACCHGPFDISAADARLVAIAVAQLPGDIREGIATRARSQLAAGGRVDNSWQHPWRVDQLGDESFDRIADAQAGEPCPALDPASGACLIHHARPATCRLTGLALSTTEGDVLENICPIRGQYPDYDALGPTPFDLMRFETAAAEHDLAAMEAGWHSTTIAGAVVLGSSES